MRGHTMPSGHTKPHRIGPLLREWRHRRNLSQLALALLAETSSRHLSFIETGRARPSRELLLRLCDQLDVPVRQRNRLLMAAGYAPAYEETPIGESHMDRANEAVERLLTGHEPYPALVFDTASDLCRANRSAMALLDGVAEELLMPPVNVVRLGLHPQGMARRITNFTEWRRHLLSRLRRDAAFTDDERLNCLYEEVRAYRYPPGLLETEPVFPDGSDIHQVAMPLHIRALGTELSFFSAVTTFVAPVDITLAELTIETFYPADTHTAGTLHSHHWNDHLHAAVPEGSPLLPTAR
ncbi:helix-turn-helix domain-containing protein [Streptomyces atratus]|uniref:Transcriptional regulator n=1 Tax=Streptomyces atratus TaxID=1893 RepID=A0A2Z5JC85_STRAR|nr:helix-turn-helix transcriptional regulator [Streptomyces atratus]AXE77981.1 transcriptional regulator [Streptomyces atratus]WPW28939.1 helix-turn-helix transcriptional regulator [Streptomyces atratus]GGT11542.1 transcriptional regulator [Streptomyces atratus]